MKIMSEFAAHVLTKGNVAKEALLAEGKSEEEVMTSLGETFKFKDNRLKYFMTALEVAKESELPKLFRVRVYTYSEGEDIPELAKQLDDVHLVAEENPAKPGTLPTVKKADQKGGRGKKDRPKGPRPSPWGESPEEAAQKKAASLKAQAEKAGKQ